MAMKTRWLKAAILVLLAAAYAAAVGKWTVKSLGVTVQCARFSQQLDGALRGGLPANLAGARLPDDPPVEAYSAKFLAMRLAESPPWTLPSDEPVTDEKVGLLLDGIARYPHDDFLHLELAALLADEDSLDADIARHAFDRLIEVAPRNAVSYYCAASVEVRKGRAGIDRALSLIEKGNDAPEIYSPYWRRREGVVQFASAHLAPSFMSAFEYTHLHSGGLRRLNDIRECAKTLARFATRELNTGHDARAAKLAGAAFRMGERMLGSDNLITVLFGLSVQCDGVEALFDVARYRKDDRAAAKLQFRRGANWSLHRQCDGKPTPKYDRVLRLSHGAYRAIDAKLANARWVTGRSVYLLGSVVSFHLAMLAVTCVLAFSILRGARAYKGAERESTGSRSRVVMGAVFVVVALAEWLLLAKCMTLCIAAGVFALCVGAARSAGWPGADRTVRPLVYLTLVLWLLVAPFAGRYAAYIETLPGKFESETVRLRPLPEATEETYERVKQAVVDRIASEAAHKAQILDRSQAEPSELRWRLRLLLPDGLLAGLAAESGQKLAGDIVIEVLRDSYGQGVAEKLRELMARPSLRAKAILALAKLRDRSALEELGELARGIEAGGSTKTTAAELAVAYAYLGEVERAKELAARALRQFGKQDNDSYTFHLRHAILNLPFPSAAGLASDYVQACNLNAFGVLDDFCTPDLALEAVGRYVRGEWRPNSFEVTHPDEYGQPKTAKPTFGSGRLRNVTVEHLDQRAIALLSQGLKSEDVEMRRFCAEGLGRIAKPGCIGPVESALEDADSIVRANACVAIWRIRRSEALPVLRQMAKDPSPLVRFAADCVHWVRTLNAEY